MNENKQIVWQTQERIHGYTYSLRVAHREEIEDLSPLVNAEEVLEVWRLFRLNVEEALERVFLLQEKHDIGIFSLYQENEFEENILAMGGLVPLGQHTQSATSLIAEIWFLGVDMDEYKRFLLLHAKEILKEFLDSYPILINIVGAWNKRNIRWLRSLGFCVEKEAYKIGEDKAFFHRFYITKEMFENKLEQ